MHEEHIRIGTLVSGADNAPGYIRQILPYGFESFAVTFWQTLGSTDLNKLAGDVADVLDGSGAVISSISMFGNPLEYREIDNQTREGWSKLIDAAHLFGCNIVSGFAGRPIDKPIDQCMPDTLRCLSRWQSMPPTRACAWLLRTAIWAAIGPAATGT